jgi:ribosomal protein L11 methylase PrmA
VNTDWGEYYEANNYTPASFREKKKLVGEFLQRIHPKVVWDLGGNTGVFSRIATAAGCDAVCFDSDYGAVEKNYRDVTAQKETHLLPLVLDLINPSPAIGWNNRERESFLERGEADAILALALVHHLAIGNNLPLGLVADFFARCGGWLIVEFIPKEDSQVKILLQSRKDIFPDYSREQFEAIFTRVYTIEESIQLPESARVLYLMRKKT